MPHDRASPSRRRAMQLALLLLPALLPLGGCLAALGTGAAVATSSYFSNGLSQIYRAHPDDVWTAALQALHDTGHIVPVGLPRDASRGEIVVSNPGPMLIEPLGLDPLPVETHLKVEALRPNTTRVFVRVGMFETADAVNQAQQILAAIARRLGADG